MRTSASSEVARDSSTPAHGEDEQDVFAELCDMVDEAIALYKKRERRCRFKAPINDK